MLRRLPHRGHHGVEVHDRIGRIPGQGQVAGRNGLHRPHRVTFDTGYLDQAPDRIAREAEVVLHSNLGRLQDLLRAPAKDFRQPGRRHGRTDANLRLTAAHRSRDGSSLLE